MAYFEETSVNQLIDFQQAPTTFSVAGGVVYDGSFNRSAAKVRLTIFQCPSDSFSDGVPESEFGSTNYAANTGSGIVNWGSLNSADGIFFKGSRIGLSDIIDGSTHTAAISERSLGPGIQTSGDLESDHQRLILEIPGGNDTTPLACALPSGNCFSERGAKWILGNYGNTLYNHDYSPNAATWDCMNLQQQKALTAARSMHPNGIGLLLCDGSVRFIFDSIDQSIWRGTATRNSDDVGLEW